MERFALHFLFYINDISCATIPASYGILHGGRRELCLVVEVAVPRKYRFQLLLLFQPFAESERRFVGTLLHTAVAPLLSLWARFAGVCIGDFARDTYQVSRFAFCSFQHKFAHLGRVERVVAHHNDW